MSAIDRAAFMASLSYACGWRRVARHYVGDVILLARVTRAQARA
jgi:hypothetical protein